MTDSVVIEIATDALVMALKLAGPVLAVSLAIGVVVSLIQAVTSIQEMTLTFVPKLLGAAIVLLVSGTWMINEITAWVSELWHSIPELV